MGKIPGGVDIWAVFGIVCGTFGIIFAISCFSPILLISNVDISGVVAIGFAIFCANGVNEVADVVGMLNIGFVVVFVPIPPNIDPVLVIGEPNEVVDVTDVTLGVDVMASVLAGVPNMLPVGATEVCIWVVGVPKDKALPKKEDADVGAGCTVGFVVADDTGDPNVGKLVKLGVPYGGGLAMLGVPNGVFTLNWK